MAYDWLIVLNQRFLFKLQWLNPQIIATVDSLERVHVIDVRSMEELEVHIV